MRSPCYKALSKRQPEIELVGCMAHVRRKFKEALDAIPKKKGEPHTKISKPESPRKASLEKPSLTRKTSGLTCYATSTAGCWISITMQQKEPSGRSSLVARTGCLPNPLMARMPVQLFTVWLKPPKPMAWSLMHGCVTCCRECLNCPREQVLNICCL